MMMNSLHTRQDLIDGYHALWFQQACNIAERVDAPIKSPRVSGKLSNRSNVPLNDVPTHSKVNVSMPFLDHLLQELCGRFTDKNCIALKGISIVPAMMREQYKSLFPTVEKQGFQDFSTAEASSPDIAEQSPSASSDGKTSGDLKLCGRCGFSPWSSSQLFCLKPEHLKCKLRVYLLQLIVFCCLLKFFVL